MDRETLQAMTVLQLRKLAKDNAIKLGTGVDKEGIVMRLLEALGGESLQEPSGHAVQDQPDMPKALQNAPLAADVTSVAPSNGYQTWPQNSRGKEAAPPQAGSQPVYRQAWQARTVTQRQPHRQPAWQAPQRSAGSPLPSRFGPQVNYTQNASAENNRPAESAQRPELQKPEGKPTLDGYRLGYQAAPQRNQYGKSDYRQEGHRPHYRNEGYSRPQHQPPAFASTAEHFNDALYKPTRDPAFHDPQNSEPLPDLLRMDEGVLAEGVLEILPDGFGFLRADTLLPGREDIYVSAAQIRRYGLRTGDKVEGKARTQKDSDKFSALLHVETVNGQPPSEQGKRSSFETMTPTYPTHRIVLESDNNQSDMPIRLVDLIAPIGFGQRAMIVAPPDSGGTWMLRELGKSVRQNDPEAHVMLLLVDTAPEDVTEIKEALDVEVFASTFTEAPESQARISETMLESAQRLVEDGKNVVILLDSLTKLTRAYQATLTQGGRTMTNTVAPAALARAKRFFGMARNTREGGSLTIIATIAIETGARVDDIIFEEFKGTANMEVRLCAHEIQNSMFPMIDLNKSGTKKEDVLLNDRQKEELYAIRKLLSATTNREAVDQLIDMMQKTKSNEDLLSRLKDWMVLLEKSGMVNKRN